MRYDARMNIRTIAPALSLLLFVGCNSVEWVDFGDDIMANPAYMEASQAAGTPGHHHAELAKGAGEWVVDGMICSEPDTEMMPMNGTSTVEVILGGRVIRQSFHSEFMGMPYEGQLLMGYDNLHDEYWSIWMDSFSTWYSPSWGFGDGEGNISMAGTFQEVQTPNGRPNRTTIETHDDGSYTQRMYDLARTGEEFLVMEFHYRRP